MNNQQPEKQVFLENLLQVNSIFYTIQGEGPYAGSPAVFVRLAGCNLQCPLCDTEYTKRTEMTVQAICKAVAHAFGDVNYDNGLVVITGGEPFRQNLTLLVPALLRCGLRVQIETNGTLFQELPYDNPDLMIICSPKTGALNVSLRPHITAFKYVLQHGSIDPDGLPITALAHPNSGTVAKPNTGSLVYVQPADEQDNLRNHLNQQAAIESAMKHGHIFCLQVHKVIGVA